MQNGFRDNNTGKEKDWVVFTKGGEHSYTKPA